MSGQAEGVVALSFHRPANINGLLFHNQLFNLLTLRLYRFWARTDLRRALWSAVVIDGEPLEYTGTGRELFLGFLKAFAVLVPLYLTLSVILDLFTGGYAVSTIIYDLYWVVVLFAFAAGDYQARRYRLSRTLWRGIYAGLDGSAWRYGLRYIVWVLLFCLTAGLSVPWACTDLARYRLCHTYWGNLRGSFNGKGADLVSVWFVTWLLSIGPLFTYAIYILQQSGWNVGQFYFEITELFYLLTHADGFEPFCFGLPFLLVGFLVNFVFQTRKWHWLIEHSAIGAMKLGCRLRKGCLLRSIDKGALIAAIYAAGAVIVINKLCADGLLAGLPFAPKIWTALAMIVVAWSGFAFIGMAWIYMPAIETLISNSTIENIAAAEWAEQGRPLRPRYGEGVADVCTTTFT